MPLYSLSRTVEVQEIILSNVLNCSQFWLVLLLLLKLLLEVNTRFLLLVVLLLFVNWFGESHSRDWSRIHKAFSRPW